MRLFVREHLGLVAAIMAQSALMIAVFWFDGYDRPLIALYALFLGLLVMGVYLTIHYMRRRHYYAMLQQPPEALKESQQDGDEAPVAQAMKRLLDKQYADYLRLLKQWERDRDRHRVFMNQWVHQMKTPLSVIELITQDSGDDKLDSMAEQTERLRHGLEMVLYMSRLETFEHDFHVERVSLQQAVHEAVSDYKRLFIRNHVYPDIQVDGALVVETDAKWLRFVLQQLLSNAVKYSAGGGRKVTVASDVRQDGAVLTVCDSGVGIPAEDLPRVFRPFFTGENGRHFKESTGMGLYLCKEVLDRMNHRVEIDSQRGKGTTVTIAFSHANGRATP